MLNNLSQLEQKATCLRDDITRSLLIELDYLREQISVTNGEPCNKRESLISLGMVNAYADVLGVHLKDATWAVRYYLDQLLAGNDELEPRHKAIKALNKVLAMDEFDI
jgi:hypothetical protein